MAATQSQTQLCRFYSVGRCNRNPCRFVHSDVAVAPPQPRHHVRTNPAETETEAAADVSLVTRLQGHRTIITGITLISGRLYSGDKDGCLRTWDCQTGQCLAQLQIGGAIRCIISEGSWLFVGIPNTIKVWNTETNIDLTLLTGETSIGEVYALAQYGDMLFAGSQSGHLLSWKFTADAVGTNNNFLMPTTSIPGAHKHSIVSLAVGNGRLYSGSVDRTIKVWDTATTTCLVTLTGHNDAVMSLLYSDGYLLSSSLDGTIRAWAISESGDQLQMVYTHTEEHGLLLLAGALDSQTKPVLLCSRNDNKLQIYDLPSFKKRGAIVADKEIRALHVWPGGLFFTGDAKRPQSLELVDIIFRKPLMHHQIKTAFSLNINVFM